VPNKKVFFAIQPSGLKDSPEIIALVKKLKVGADRKALDINWTPDLNWHFTLSFLGEIDEVRMPELSLVLQTVAKRFTCFNLPLKGLGAFPSEASGRVLWVGAPAKAGLVNLQSGLEAELVARGFSVDERGYRPHLSLGRLRNPKNVKDLLSPFVRNKFGEFSVEEILLMESIQARFFPVYKILDRAPLQPVVSE